MWHHQRNTRRVLEECLKSCNPPLHVSQTPHTVFDKLQRAVDPEASMEGGSTSIRDGYDSQLDRLRNIYDSLESFLTQAAHQVLQIVPLLQVTPCCL
jgi:DNA mismatch repair ATPase MutS